MITTENGYLLVEAISIVKLRKCFVTIFHTQNTLISVIFNSWIETEIKRVAKNIFLEGPSRCCSWTLTDSFTLNNFVTRRSRTTYFFADANCAFECVQCDRLRYYKHHCHHYDYHSTTSSSSSLSSVIKSVVKQPIFSRTSPQASTSATSKRYIGGQHCSATAASLSETPNIVLDTLDASHDSWLFF